MIWLLIRGWEAVQQDMLLFSLGRHFAGFDVVEEYVAQANIRLLSISPGGVDNGEGQET